MLEKAREWFGLSEVLSHGSHGHGHDDDGGHGHTHGVINPTIATTERGIWAIKWSFVILAITAALQIAVAMVTGSVALLADTIHNVADATTAIPLWVAFKLAQRKPTETFTYGYGRVEDLAGIAIVLVILFSAIVAGYESINRIFNPAPITMLGWVAMAGIIGFIGNEVVAVLRIKVGKEINSAALIADGYHARTDGLTSLAVVAGAIGVWLGFPLADPIIGLLITLAIFGIVWQSARSVLTRMLDGVDPAIISEVRHSADHVAGVKKVLDVKARWLGHKLHTEVVVEVDPSLSVTEADKIGEKLRAEMLAHIPALSVANVRCQGSGVLAAELVPKAAEAGGHHHAPEPFKVKSTLGNGLLEIVDTPKGERMRLTLEQADARLVPTVTIDRAGGRVEALPLFPAANNTRIFESHSAPEEPHEFAAQLRLKAGEQTDVLDFKMAEPAGHH
jgi:cation diffusion facilitator family transporter